MPLSRQAFKFRSDRRALVGDHEVEGDELKAAGRLHVNLAADCVVLNIRLGRRGRVDLDLEAAHAALGLYLLEGYEDLVVDDVDGTTTWTPRCSAT